MKENQTDPLPKIGERAGDPLEADGEGRVVSHKWGHDELAEDLAVHLRGTPRRLCWTNIPMGPAGSVRPDVFAMFKSFTKPCPVSYEVKVSRSDFRADVTAGKWQAYLAFSSAVIFAAPSGLLTKADLPRGCGLITRSDKAWRTVKAHASAPVELDSDVFMKLLMTGIDDIAQGRWAPDNRKHWYGVWAIQSQIKGRVGWEAARFIADKEGARKELADMRAQVSELGTKMDERRRQQDANAPQLLLELSRIFGVEPGSGAGDLEERIRWAAQRRARELDVDALGRKLEALVRDFDALRNHRLVKRGRSANTAEVIGVEEVA